MKPLLHEAMVSVKHYPWRVRLWIPWGPAIQSRTEIMADQHDVLRDVHRLCDDALSPQEVADTILTKHAISAVEVVDDEGNGVVVYDATDWLCERCKETPVG